MEMKDTNVFMPLLHSVFSISSVPVSKNELKLFTQNEM